MKKYIYLVFVSFLPFMFSYCGASKTNEDIDFQHKPPFKIVKATYNNWEDEQSGVRGIQVELAIDDSEITLDTIYFRNMKTWLKKELNSVNELYVGTFVYPKKEMSVLHSDSKKEYGNKVPDITIKIPFKLKKDEAVISYFYKKRLNFFKVEHLMETKESSITN